MDPRTSSALTLGWQLVAATLAQRGWLTGPVWARAFGELRRAEAAARRLLVILASGVAVEAAAPAPAVKAHPANLPQTGPKTPGFALFDPLPEPVFGTGGDVALPVDSAPAFHSTEGLAARLAALSAFADDPAPTVRRMAFWLARGRGKRTSPLRPGLPPGVSGDLMDRESDVAMQCDHLARARLNRPVPP
jgi:hypothetical protein